MLVLILLVLATVIAITLAITILRASKASRLNRLLAYATFFVSVWAIGDILMLYAENLSLARIGAVLFYVGPMITTLLLLYFADSSPTGKPLKKRLVIPAAMTAFALGGLIIIYPDFLINTIMLNEGTRNTIIPNKISLNIYSLYFNVFFIATYIKLIMRYRHNNGILKSQLLVMLIAITITSALAVTTNLVMPQLGIYDKVWLGPIFTLFFSGMTIFAIMKHRYLDVKLFAARATAYLLTLGFFIGMYITLVYLLSLSLISTNILHENNQVFSIAVAVILAFTFTPLKRYFDRVTNKIFYQDAYDPQEFLDELNRTIVANIEIGILVRHTTAVISQNLKSEFCQIVTLATQTTTLRVAGTKSSDYTASEISFLHEHLKDKDEKLIVIDDLSLGESELRKILLKHRIAFVIRLCATYYGEEHDIAYLLLGNKKSGNLYNEQDFRIMDIVAHELIIAIQNALRFEEIQDFNVTLQKKVNDATSKLKKSNEKLKSMDATKDEFISMASHQLRTPLTSVKGYLSMVLEGDAGDITESQRQLLDQAFVSSQRMVYLIADLLNVSRLKTDKFVINAQPTNLADLVEGEVSQLTEQARLKNIELTYKKPQELTPLMLDETKVRQVVMNFVDNALYYTLSGGKIIIRVKEDSGHVYFTVEDNGLGVPRDEQKHLFTKFYRAKNARKARPDGTGLGLFMAKKVVTAQGGNILFESHEGKGSTFGFTFSKKHLAIE